MTEEIERLRDLAHEVCLGPSTRAIVQAAQARNIPCRRLNSESLVAFWAWPQAAAHPGGRDRPHRRHSRGHRPGQGDDPQVAAGGWRADALRAAGERRRGRLGQAACEIGVPVVVKPQDGNQGRGVATNLATREQVVAGYRRRAQGRESGAGRKICPRP